MKAIRENDVYENNSDDVVIVPQIYDENFYYNKLERIQIMYMQKRNYKDGYIVRNIDYSGCKTNKTTSYVPKEIIKKYFTKI